jgi:hypothetical protein
VFSRNKYLITILAVVAAVAVDMWATPLRVIHMSTATWTSAAAMDDEIWFAHP